MGTNDEARREFLADLSCMANTEGGVILFGIATERDASGDDTGLASSLAPLGLANWESERLRILQMANDGLSPPLSSALSLNAIKVSAPGDQVIAIGVPRSIAGPHMVSFQKRNQFFRRSEAGKYLPAVDEIRRMFLEGQTWVEQAEAFRLDRLSALDHGRIPRFFSSVPAVVIQVLPLGRMETFLDLQQHSGALAGNLEPLNPAGHSGYYNADGYLRFTGSPYSVEPINGYAQCFRFGGIEGGTAPIGRDIGKPGKPDLALFGTDVQVKSARFIERALRFISGDLEMEGPYGILFSYLRIHQYSVLDVSGMRGRPIETDRALAPLITIPDPVAPYEVLARAFDLLWQCSGIAGAPPVAATA